MQKLCVFVSLGSGYLLTCRAVLVCRVGWNRWPAHAMFGITQGDPVGEAGIGFVIQDVEANSGKAIGVDPRDFAFALNAAAKGKLKGKP